MDEKVMVTWHADFEDVLIMRFEESTDWGVFHRAVNTAHQMIKTKTGTVHLIVKPPPLLPHGNPITAFTIVTRKQPANMGRLVAVVPTMRGWLATLMQRTIIIMERVYPLKRVPIFALSDEEAIALIKQERSAPLSA